MKQKVITSVLTLGMMGFMSLFVGYRYESSIYLGILCLYFIFTLIMIRKKLPHRFIPYTVVSVFTLINVAGLITGNVKTERLADNILLLFLILLLPYFCALAFSTHRKWRLISVIVFLGIGYFTTFYYYLLLQNYLNYETYTGTYDYKLKRKLAIHSMDDITKNLSPEKTYVIDLWNRHCGVCFIKFSKFGKLKAKFEDRSDIEFLALNIYESEEDIKPSQVKFNKSDLNFPTYYLSDQDAAELNPEFFPIVLVIKNNQIIFRGHVETLNALDFKYLPQ